MLAKAAKHGLREFKLIRLKNEIWMTAIIYIPIIFPQIMPKTNIANPKYWTARANLEIIPASL